MADHYHTLGLVSTATQSDIKAAYRQKASLYHPDKNTLENAVMAAELFKKVQEAYDVLGDPVLRQSYDQQRRNSLLDSPIETATEIWQRHMNGVLNQV